MRINNIEVKKVNAKYLSGDVLITHDGNYAEAYMVIERFRGYNIVNLHTGEIRFIDYEDHDDFVKNLEKIFSSIRRIDNNKLELIEVED